MRNTYKYTKIILILIGVLFVCGCTTSTTGTGASSFLKTNDGGKTWMPKVKVSEEQNISGVDVLTIAINPQNPDIIYLGTVANGLFITKDGAETWEKLNFPPTKIYGLAIDNQNSQNIYASGVYNNRAKIYSSSNAGTDWKEIYTEPGNGTVITALALGKNNNRLIFAGTDQGTILESGDSGETWKNLPSSQAAVIDIAIENNNENTAYFGIYNQGILRIKNGEEKIDDLKNFMGLAGNYQVVSVISDPNIGGTIYAGLSDGLIRSRNFGDSWEKVNILSSSTKFPIRAIAINPRNSNEIIYSAGGAIYKSTDSGNTWSTFQLNSGKEVRVLQYNPSDPSIIYAGLRKS